MKRDMLPYMAIVCVFWLMFSFFTVAILYKPTGRVALEKEGGNIFAIIFNFFFAMFGEFNVAYNVFVIGKYCIILHT